MPALDLTTAVLFNNVTLDAGTLLVEGGAGEFTLPGAYIADTSSHYAVTVTYDDMPVGGFIALYSIPSPDATGYSTGWWYRFGSHSPGSSSSTGVGGEPGSGSTTIYLGPGVADWPLLVDGAIDERYMVINVSEGLRVTGVSFEPVTLATSDPVQAADVVQDERASYDLITDSDSVFGYTEGERSVPAPGDHDIYTPPEMAAAVLDAASSNDGPGPHGALTTVAAYVAVNYTYGPGGVPDGDRISHLDAQHAFNVGVIRARYDFSPPARPSDAIGYVWESGSLSATEWAEPVSATLLAAESTVRLVNADTTADLGDMPPPEDPAYVWRPTTHTDVWLRPVSLDPVAGTLGSLPPVDATLGEPGSPVQLDWSLDYEANYWVEPGVDVGQLPASDLGVSDLDLTGFIDDDGREDKSSQWAIYTRTPAYTPKGQGDGRTILFEGELAAKAGAGLLFTDFFGTTRSGVVVRWTYRPPQFRWVLLEEESTPYRRAFPNDAVTEGARRTFPPSKAVQSNRRTSGAYL